MYDTQTGEWIEPGKEPISAPLQREPVYKHLAATFGWMFLALAITFVTSYAVYATGALYYVFASPYLLIAMVVAKLVMVAVLSRNLYKFSVGAARTIFLAYAATTGVVLSSLFLLYDVPSAILLFLAACVYFGAMAAAGIITKKDVSGLGGLVTCGLIGLLVMTVLSMVFRLSGLDIAVSFIGLALFMGITTYDAKRAKDYYYSFEGDGEMLKKISIYSALNLYLDFINIFLYLLRLLGKRRK